MLQTLASLGTCLLLHGPRYAKICWVIFINTVVIFVFQNQFKSNFVAAVDSAPKVVPVGVHAPQNPDPEPHIVPLKRRKKTRWE